MASRPGHSLTSWSHLAVDVHQPRPWGLGPNVYAMGPNQDDGDEVPGDFDLWIGIEGSCQVCMLGHTLDLRPGRVVLIPAGVRARQRTGPDQTLLMIYVHFDCLLDGRPVSDASPYVDPQRLRLALPGLPELSLMAEIDAATIRDRFHSIRTRPEDDLSELMLTATLLEIMAQFRKAYLGLASLSTQERIEQAVAFMEQNLHGSLSLAAVARHVHVSPQTLGRLFRSYLGVSPMQHLARQRMARARELLQDRRNNISEVARACGYASLQYFSRTFRRECGTSPSVFRKRLPLIP